MTPDGGHKVLIAGGGAAAFEAVLTLRELAPALDVELITPCPVFVHGPMRYSLSRLAELGVVVRHGNIERVDGLRRIVTTRSGEELAYDALLIATGAQAREPAEDAPTLAEVEGGHVRSLALVAPLGVIWTLPLYELALSLPAVEVMVATAEARPLEVFGEAASDLLDKLLSEHGVRFAASPDDVAAADRRITIPLPGGHHLEGVPADADGFLGVDAYGQVMGIDRVWAAGDGTNFAIKEPGLAAQQGETAARSIGTSLGSAIEVTPFEPVLRGVLIAARRPWYLRRRLDGIDLGQVSPRALWWPPSTIAGRRLAPFLDRLQAGARSPRLEPVT